jgi:hypothetical protein
VCLRLELRLWFGGCQLNLCTPTDEVNSRRYVVWKSHLTSNLNWFFITLFWVCSCVVVYYIDVETHEYAAAICKGWHTHVNADVIIGCGMRTSSAPSADETFTVCIEFEIWSMFDSRQLLTNQHAEDNFVDWSSPMADCSKSDDCDNHTACHAQCVLLWRI